MSAGNGGGPSRLPVLQGCGNTPASCSVRACRQHLGGSRVYRGHTFRCALAVADAFPLGLPPQAMVVLLRVGHSEAQKLEHRAFRKFRLGLQMLANLEHGRASRARREGRSC